MPQHAEIDKTPALKSYHIAVCYLAVARHVYFRVATISNESVPCSSTSSCELMEDVDRLEECRRV